MDLKDYINSEKVLSLNDIDETSYFVDEKFEPNEITPDSLCLVHSTAFFPFNNTILSSMDGNKLTIDKKAYSMRPTVHFVLNGVVTDHYAGSWSENPYTIIEPLNKHLNEIKCIHSVDTWTANSVKLSDKAIILVDIRAKDYLKDSTLYKSNVIYYDGNRNVIVNFVLTQLGYKPQSIGEKTWAIDSYGNDNFSSFRAYFEEKYPHFILTLHYGTSYYFCEKNLTHRDRFLYNVNYLLETKTHEESLVQSKNGLILDYNQALMLIKRSFILAMSYYEKEKYNIKYNELNGDITEFDISFLKNIDLSQIINVNKDDVVNELVNIGIIYDENKNTFRLVPANILFKYYELRYMINDLASQIKVYEDQIKSLEFYKTKSISERNKAGYTKTDEEINYEIKRIINLIEDRKKIIEQKNRIYVKIHKKLFMLGNKVYDEFIKLLTISKKEKHMG